MSLEIRPDPRHPNGGHALIALSDPPEGGEVVVSVFDVFSQRHLGEGGWQATAVRFGPYPVERAGGEALVRIGPEIVNRIEEYAALRLTVAGLAGGERSGEVTWPDDIVPLPGAAAKGGIYVARAAAPEKPDNLVGRLDAAPEAAARPAAPSATPQPREPEKAPPQIVIDDPETVTGGGGGRRPLLLAALALLAILAAGLGWFLTRSEPEPPPAPPVAAAPAPTPVPAVPAAPAPGCDAAAFAGLQAQGFGSTLARLSECGAAVTPERALALIEEAAAGEDSLALLQLGELYDRSATGGVVKSVIGLAFDDTPPNAAEYYFRARAAGSPLAADRLATLCARMAGASDTLSLTALEEYCAP